LIKAAFLDRDGVINKEVNYLHKIRDFRYTKDCIKGLKLLKRIGFELVIVTNQAGIAKGIFTQRDHQNLSNWLIQDLAQNDIELLDYIFCPHHPEGIIEEYTVECDCRKPNPGMLLNARKNHNIDLENSILIGDKSSDIQAAKRAGVGSFFLVDSGHVLEDDACLLAPVHQNLYEVSKWLSTQSK